MIPVLVLSVVLYYGASVQYSVLSQFLYLMLGIAAALVFTVVYYCSSKVQSNVLLQCLCLVCCIRFRHQSDLSEKMHVCRASAILCFWVQNPNE